MLSNYTPYISLEDFMKLIFVYLGKLPNYTYYSLHHALIYSKCEVTLLVDRTIPKKYKKLIHNGLNIVIIDSFYLRPEFLNNHLKEVKKFRNGFWTKTLERFYVLEQYARNNSITQFFHGEIDNLFYDLDYVSLILEKSEKLGLFLPRHDDNRLIASIVYVNALNELSNFCFFIANNDYNKNEMELLSDWQKSRDSKLYILKSILNEKNVLTPIYDLNQKSELIFDAARIGQWLFGVDPRNKLGTILNNDDFILEDQPELSNYKFSYRNNKIEVIYNQETHTLVNVHIHSKIIKKIIKNDYLKLILEKTNNSEKRIITLNIRSYFNPYILFHTLRVFILKLKTHIF